jgi:hypothetical protein
MDLPEEADAVFDVVLACHQKALAVHASIAGSLLEQHRSGSGAGKTGGRAG